MFIGHFALGFAAKRWAPRQSLGVLIAAPIFVDMLWPVLCLTGIERFHIEQGNTAYQPLVFDYYPWSHSLVMGLLWGGLFGLLVDRTTRDRAGAIVAGALVVSHWVLDFVSHAPDMPLWPGGPRFGLGLWNSIPATVVVESLLFITGVGIYVRATKALDKIGIIGLWSLVLLLAVSYAGSSNGQAPPNLNAVLIVGVIATPLSVAWAWWADKHRTRR